jgi:hypothetical protein
MKDHLYDCGQLVEAVQVSDALERTGTHHLDFASADAAFEYLKRFVPDRLNMMVLRRLLADDQYSSYGIAEMDDHEVLRQLAYRLACGSIKLSELAAFTGTFTRWARFEPAPSMSATRPTEISEPTEAPRARPAASSRSPVTAPPLTWIEFRVLDDDTGQPVSGVKLRLMLPDGTTGTYSTNAEGKVRFTDLIAGVVDLEQMLDDDALEVVHLE